MTVTLPYSEKNRAALDKYEELLYSQSGSTPRCQKTASSKSHFRSGCGQREIKYWLVHKIAKKNQIRLKFAKMQSVPANKSDNKVIVKGCLWEGLT